eukprot:TRINITY_DN1716_c0_g1_i1.p1 TRINITY_DN1716_c0_g1~~TRINITY_DN1716_c0_g1_i1.p1  ORF type:complete len:102 (-),score=4.66 TRINITY_DN1716_c0_g1_i1:113-418(-)
MYRVDEPSWKAARAGCIKSSIWEGVVGAGKYFALATGGLFAMQKLMPVIKNTTAAGKVFLLSSAAIAGFYINCETSLHECREKSQLEAYQKLEEEMKKTAQ